MIEADMRRAIMALHEQGMGIREIARRLSISRNTVRAIVAQQGKVNEAPRSDLIVTDTALLTELYGRCAGWRERIWEELTEKHGVKIGYSTLTRKIRELGFDVAPRANRVPDEPGAEMQHDTSPHRLKIGGQPVAVTSSLLYYRYSKQYYLRFYRHFTRFHMKCFLHEALTFYGYAAPKCITDNTKLVVLRGSGSAAVMIPEMIQFGRRYGFEFVPHALGHPDRKAGEERGFWTIESNFFPGRTFSSLEDMNAQALEWATVRWANRPRGKSKIIPVEAFSYEKALLKPVPKDLPAPYRLHNRTVDQYGYVAFGANYYWVPVGTEGEVKVLEYSDKIKVIAGRRALAEYQLPPDKTRNEIFPADRPHVGYQPRHRENSAADEESQLRRCSPAVASYLDFALTGAGLRRNQWLRELHALQRRVSPNLFIQIVERAHRFKETDVRVLEEIARVIVRGDMEVPVDTSFDETYADRESFREGRFTDPPDFSTYDRLLEDDDG